MEVRKIVFSPSGGTRALVDLLADSLGESKYTIDISRRDFEGLDLKDDSIYIIGAPTFASRMPQMVVDNLAKIRAHGQRAIVIASFGNRHFDDALEELRRAAKESGFKVLVGLGLVAEHSIFKSYGTGRPDEEDKKDIREFAGKILEKLQAGDSEDFLIPHNEPFIERRVSTIRPETDRDKCIKCGICVKGCPTESIDKEDPSLVADSCIACMRCISVCPKGAKGLNPLVRKIGDEHMKDLLSSRKDNYLFL